jgi:hypothetical protein
MWLVSGGGRRRGLGEVNVAAEVDAGEPTVAVYSRFVSPSAVESAHLLPFRCLAAGFVSFACRGETVKSPQQLQLEGLCLLEVQVAPGRLFLGVAEDSVRREVAVGEAELVLWGSLH